MDQWPETGIGPWMALFVTTFFRRGFTQACLWGHGFRFFGGAAEILAQLPPPLSLAQARMTPHPTWMVFQPEVSIFEKGMRQREVFFIKRSGKRCSDQNMEGRSARKFCQIRPWGQSVMLGRLAVPKTIGASGVPFMGVQVLRW